MSLKRFFLPVALFISVVFLFTQQSIASEYQHTLTEGDMTFSWSINGDKLAALVSAPTTGWVSVGFNPTDKMKDANIIIGKVTKKGDQAKVTITDEYGIAAVAHKKDKKIGGASDVEVVSGTEEGDVTTIEFIIPLNSGDEKDSVLDPAGDTMVILAYAAKDSFRLKHKKAYTLTVNLGSGATK